MRARSGAGHQDLYQRLTDNIAGATLEERFRIYAGSREVAQIVRENGVDKTLFFHADHLGTPETITTSDGDVAHQDLDPWGNASSSGTEVTRVGFTGHEHDRDLGFIDMKGRVYDPLAARFTTADPIMQAPNWSQGLNRYAYTFNDPVNHTDPSGFQAGMICTMLGACYPNVAPSGAFAGDAGASSAASGGAASSSSGSSAGGVGGTLGTVAGIAGPAISTVAKALEGGFLGQNSVPSGKSQSTSTTGQQAATSTPPRVGTDAASVNRPFESPVQGGFFERPPPGSELGQEGRGNAGAGPRMPDPGRYLTRVGDNAYKLSAEGRERLRVLDHTGYDLGRIRFRFRPVDRAYAAGDLVTLPTRWDTYSPDRQVRTLAHESTHPIQQSKLGYLRMKARLAREGLASRLKGVSEYDQPTDLVNASAKQLDPVDARFNLEAIADKMGDAAMGYGE